MFDMRALAAWWDSLSEADQQRVRDHQYRLPADLAQSLADAGIVGRHWWDDRPDEPAVVVLPQDVRNYLEQLDSD